VGVNAPRDVAVHREEIYERIKREEQASRAAHGGNSGHAEHGKANGSTGPA
jgi:carbon storage regulator